SGEPMGTPITPAMVARVLAHPEGGCKGVVPGARVCVMINKVESLADRTPAYETAERLLREPAIHSVLLTTLPGRDPVLEVCARGLVGWGGRHDNGRDGARSRGHHGPRAHLDARAHRHSLPGGPGELAPPLGPRRHPADRRGKDERSPRARNPHHRGSDHRRP